VPIDSLPHIHNGIVTQLLVVIMLDVNEDMISVGDYKISYYHQHDIVTIVPQVLEPTIEELVALTLPL